MFNLDLNILHFRKTTYLALIYFEFPFKRQRPDFHPGVA